MPSLAPVMIEFRCNRCWQSNFADSDASGTKTECRHCGNSICVPEATEDRIARAKSMLHEHPEILDEPSRDVDDVSNRFDYTPTERELEAIARRSSYVPLKQMNFSSYPAASVMARLIACAIDGGLTLMALLAGFFLCLRLAKHGMLEDVMSVLRRGGDLSLNTNVVLYSFFVLLILGQWCLVSLHGQTIGKKLMMIRIVSISGTLPGFIQGVLLRNWLFGLLSLVPFVGLIDCLLIFTSSGRCLHDYVAGTRVISSV